MVTLTQISLIKIVFYYENTEGVPIFLNNRKPQEVDEKKIPHRRRKF